jgi:transposase
MPRVRSAYTPDFGRQMVELVWSGRTPEELAREFESKKRGPNKRTAGQISN